MSETILENNVVSRIIPEVFILILNWNGWQDTVECVDSCRNLDYPNFRIVMIDNGSTDDSEKLLRERYTDICILQTGSNLGFAGGNNAGIRYALERGADYVWLLNNDTTVAPDSLTELVKVVDGRTNIGMAGSKILLYDQPDTLHFAGAEISLIDGNSRHLGILEKDVGQYDQVSEMGFLTGCSLLVSCRMIEQIGLMPEEYFLYFEESDWCLRARRASYRLIFTPYSQVFHKLSASVLKVSERKTYYLVRNRLFFLSKWGEDVFWLRRFFLDAKLFLRHALKRRFRHAYVVLLAYRHWFQNNMGPLFALKTIRNSRVDQKPVL